MKVCVAGERGSRSFLLQDLRIGPLLGLETLIRHADRQGCICGKPRYWQLDLHP